MAEGQVYIIPQRNDVAGMSLFLRDLWPRSSQRNLIYDPDGQTHYLNASLDFPGTTTTLAGAYVSGSTNTAPITDAVADDTTGGGNDVLATQTTELGLAAYLRDRVQPGGVALATAGRMAIADAVTLAAAIRARALAGQVLNVAALNVVLSTVALGGTAATDLDGTAALSRSFGTVEEVLRVLQGEVYQATRFTIICNVANQFQTEAQRDVLVAAQISATTGQTFVSTGAFLTTGTAGFRNLPVYWRTSAMNASLGTGYLAELQTAQTFLNPNFAYAAVDVTAVRPRAYDLGGTVLPATGVFRVVRAYDYLGDPIV